MNYCLEHEKFNYKCRECCRQYQRWHYQQNKETYSQKHKEWYQENKEEHKEKTKGYSRLRKFGLTQEQFDSMLLSQKGMCSICTVVINTSAHVDHDHITGRIRGLLCMKCNAGLGLFNDSWQLLSSAMNYLERNE